LLRRASQFNSRRLDMSTKKAVALAGMLFILGAGLALAQTQTKAAETNMAQNRVNTQVQGQVQNRNLFQTRTSTTAGIMYNDENGDGICDVFRDHDNDGVPNCQDPDWQAPKDGTGYKTPARATAAGARLGAAGGGFRGGNMLGNAAFRKGLGGRGLGTGVCDGTGPKGNLTRRGRG
jgi:hypothetical protein